MPIGRNFFCEGIQSELQLNKDPGYISFLAVLLLKRNQGYVSFSADLKIKPQGYFLLADVALQIEIKVAVTSSSQSLEQI